jgi:hypothetical protein
MTFTRSRLPVLAALALAASLPAPGWAAGLQGSYPAVGPGAQGGYVRVRTGRGHGVHDGFGGRHHGFRHHGRVLPTHGAFGFGGYPFVHHRGFYVEPSYPAVRTIVEREREPAPAPSYFEVPTVVGIREAPPSRPALYVINAGRPGGAVSKGGVDRPLARVVELGEPSARSMGARPGDGDWGVPFTGPKIVHVTVPRRR